MKKSLLFIVLILIIVQVSYGDFIAFSKDKDLRICSGTNYHDYIYVKIVSPYYEVVNFRIYSNNDNVIFNSSEFVVHSNELKKIDRYFKANGKESDFKLITYIKGFGYGTKEIIQNAKVVDCTPLKIKGLSKDYIVSGEKVINFRIESNSNDNITYNVSTSIPEAFIGMMNNSGNKTIIKKLTKVILERGASKNLVLYSNITKSCKLDVLFISNETVISKNVTFDLKPKRDYIELKQKLTKGLEILFIVILILLILLFVNKKIKAKSKRQSFSEIDAEKQMGFAIGSLLKEAKKESSQQIPDETKIIEPGTKKKVKADDIKKPKEIKKKIKKESRLGVYMINSLIVILIAILFFLVFKIVPVVDNASGIDVSMSPSLGSSLLYLYNGISSHKCNLTISDNLIIDLDKLFYDNTKNKLSFSILESPKHINLTLNNSILELLPNKDYIGRDRLVIKAYIGNNSRELSLDLCIIKPETYAAMLDNLNYYLHVMTLAMALLTLLVVISKSMAKPKAGEVKEERVVKVKRNKKVAKKS
jgi:hypothetical protein